jgi:hypothetical protein
VRSLPKDYSAASLKKPVRAQVIRTPWRKQRHVANSFPTYRRYVAAVMQRWDPVVPRGPDFTERSRGMTQSC